MAGGDLDTAILPLSHFTAEKVLKSFGKHSGHLPPDPGGAQPQVHAVTEPSG